MMERVEQQVGNYRLKQLLGKGAFADVYLGEHLYLSTSVAVKVLRSRLDSPTLADFLTEARHVSHLVHPHIIRVFDFGLESNVPFLVMDYASYGNLRQKHPPGSAVPLPTIVTYTLALASALQYAHDQHLIHRNLHLADADRATWADRLEREVGNLRAALEWLLERKKGEEALRLAAALRQFWSLSGYLTEGRSFLEQALEVAKESQAPVSPAVRAKALYAAGWLAYRQKDPEYATPLLEESQRLSRSLGDKRGEASALTCLSTICHERGKGGMANALLKVGVKLYREIGDDSDRTRSVVRKGGAEALPASLSVSPTVLLKRSTGQLLPPAYEELTAREIDVLRLLATGLSNKQIARRLVLSPHTVNGHIHSIFGKLAVNSRSAATRYALEHHLA